ncbi:MAG TPA: 2'-5' RNA ligase family protein [Anaerolineales bacterium]|nr:2'-5' RNA ligase family protein [Anaerolineales bacterium]
MKATFALLGNAEVHNLVRKLAWDIHQRYQTGTRHASLPPHISLKQPFAIRDLSALEEYMGELARSIDPFEVRLIELQVRPLVFGRTEYGLLWLDVQETEELRGLHNRINAELAERFGNTQADFDASGYHFHMTVMMGGQSLDTYLEFFNEIPDPRIDLRYTVRELAMFVYDGPMGPDGEYLSYKILPIGRLFEQAST